MILSAMYRLVDLDEETLRYQMRLGHRCAITAQVLREQAEQLELRDPAEVVVLAPAAYANLAVQVFHVQSRSWKSRTTRYANPPPTRAASYGSCPSVADTPMRLTNVRNGR
jgi:hypothetical protein